MKCDINVPSFYLVQVPVDISMVLVVVSVHSGEGSGLFSPIVFY